MRRISVALVLLILSVPVSKFARAISAGFSGSVRSHGRGPDALGRVAEGEERGHGHRGGLAF